jgi:hypothetical protein
MMKLTNLILLLKASCFIVDDQVHASWLDAADMQKNCMSLATTLVDTKLGEIFIGIHSFVWT